MAHELDFSKGRAAIAFRGAVPWHGLGESILPEDSIDDIRIKAGLDYDVIKAPVQYTREIGNRVVLPGGVTRAPEAGEQGIPCFERRQSNDFCVLYRSDTGDDLSVVSPKYQVVQPREIVDFYKGLTEKFGFELEVVGALKGGRKVWALANTNNAFSLRDGDENRGYLLLATSYDGSMATQARFTSIRVVCNNTLSLANRDGRPQVSVPHSTKFDAARVKAYLGLDESWEQYRNFAAKAQSRVASRQESVRLFLAAYYGLDTPEKIDAFRQDEKNNAGVEKFLKRMTGALFESPGAQMASARGTLWGVLQAVTFDVDHELPSRSTDTRLDKAWFGNGDNIKRRALSFAEALVA
jgi:phage/plasmid-like protein (TIGR03299 family)